MNLLEECFVPYSVPITVGWTRDRMIDVQPLLNPPPPIPQSCQCLMVHSNKPTFNLHITGTAPTYWPGWLLLSNGVGANLRVKFEMESISAGWMTWGVNYILNLVHSSLWHLKKRWGTKEQIWDINMIPVRGISRELVLFIPTDSGIIRVCVCIMTA